MIFVPKPTKSVNLLFHQQLLAKKASRIWRQLLFNQRTKSGLKTQRKLMRIRFKKIKKINRIRKVMNQAKRAWNQNLRRPFQQQWILSLCVLYSDQPWRSFRTFQGTSRNVWRKLALLAYSK